MPAMTAAIRQTLNCIIKASDTLVVMTSMPRARTGASTKSTSGPQSR